MLRKPERFLSEKRFDEAIELLKEMQEKKGFKPDIILRLANAYQASGDLAKTEEIFQDGVRHFPKNSVLLFNLGKFYIDNEKYEPAAECFERCIQLNPQNLLAHSYLGITLFALTKYDEAVKIFKEHGIETNNEFLARFSCIVETGIAKNPELFPEASAALLWVENSPLYRLYTSLADKSLWRSILKPFIVRKLLKKAEKIMFAGNFEGTHQILDRLLQISPANEHALLGKAVAFFEQKKYEQSRELFIKLIEIKGDYPPFIAQIGICSYFLGEYENAKNIFEKIPTDGPEDYNAYYYSALIALSTSNKEKAMELFKIAHSRFFVDTSEQCLKPLLGRVLRFKGNK